MKLFIYTHWSDRERQVDLLSDNQLVDIFSVGAALHFCICDVTWDLEHLYPASEWDEVRIIALTYYELNSTDHWLLMTELLASSAVQNMKPGDRVYI
jgi:hypothetical protein